MVIVRWRTTLGLLVCGIMIILVHRVTVGTLAFSKYASCQPCRQECQSVCQSVSLPSVPPSTPLLDEDFDYSLPHMLIIYRSIDEGSKGYGIWTQNMVQVLRSLSVRLRFAYVWGTSEKLVPLPSTRAVLLQDYEEQWLAAHGKTFAGRIFLGPFALNHISSHTLLNGTTILLESLLYVHDVEERIKRVGLNATVIGVPMGVDTEHLKPVLAQSNRTVPILQMKYYENHTFNETALHEMLVTNKVREHERIEAVF